MLLLLGLIILAAAAVAAVELVMANRGPVDFHMWSWTWHFDAFWLAVVGAIIITAAWLALALMQASVTHARRVRLENRALAEQNRLLAERAEAAETVDPVVVERPYPAARAYDPNVSQHSVAPEGTYPLADPAVAGTPTAGGYPVDDPGVAETEQHGFFSRHSASGRTRRR